MKNAVALNLLEHWKNLTQSAVFLQVTTNSDHRLQFADISDTQGHKLNQLLLSLKIYEVTE